jgi:hypothetical protein
MRKRNQKQFYRSYWCRRRSKSVSRTINFKSNIRAEFYRRRSSDFIRVHCKQARFTEIKPYFFIKTPRRGSYYILHKMQPRENSPGPVRRRARADAANHRSRAATARRSSSSVFLCVAAASAVAASAYASAHASSVSSLT